MEGIDVTRDKDVNIGTNKYDRLDDFLRGNVNKREEERQQKREAAARSRAVQDQIADSMGGERRPGDDDGDLYFATVLIVDSDPDAAGHAAEVLEANGYFVDIEDDGRKVMEMILYEGDDQSRMSSPSERSVSRGGRRGMMGSRSAGNLGSRGLDDEMSRGGESRGFPGDEDLPACVCMRPCVACLW